MEAPETRRVRPALLGVLDRHCAPRVRPPERVGDVAAHVAEEVGGRESEPRQNFREVKALPEVHAGSPKSRSPSPVTTMFRIDSGKRSEERRVGKECRSRWSPDH